MISTRKQALLNACSPQNTKQQGSGASIRRSTRQSTTDQQHQLDQQEEDDYDKLKQRNGANKRARAEQSFVVEQKAATKDSPSSSQVTQEQTTAAPVRSTLDFSLYTHAMLQDEDKKKASSAYLFTKKPLLQISQLKMAANQSQHLKRNKLSEKMGRRDIQFYDLYKLKKPAQEVENLENKGYLLDGVLAGDYKDEATGQMITMTEENEPIYGDLEVDDFNKLFRNEHLIKQKFGDSICVKLQTESDGTVTREVIEELTKVVSDDNALNDLECDVNEMSYYSQAPHQFSQGANDFEDGDIYASQMRFGAKSLDNPQVKTMLLQLQNLRDTFTKSNKEICEAFIKTSGNMDRVRQLLDKKNTKPVVTWSALEDMALTEPDISDEFQVLLLEKGWQEIVTRRNFLQVKPIFDQKFAQENYKQ